METRSQERLRTELIQLIEKQISTLENRAFVGITDDEEREYEERQKRVRDLFIELYHIDPAA